MYNDILGTGGYVPPQMYGLDKQKPSQKKKQKNFWEDNISTGGSLAGALAGGAAGTAILPGIGTLIGGLLGGAVGGAGGQVAENAYVGDKLDTDVASEALWGGVTALPFGAVGKLGKAGFTVAKGLGSDAARTAAKDLITEAGVKAMTPGQIAKYTAQSRQIPSTISEALSKGSLGSNILSMTNKSNILDSNASRASLMPKVEEAQRFNQLALENIKKLAAERATQGLPLANGGGTLVRAGEAPSFVSEGVKYMDVPKLPDVSPYSFGGLKSIVEKQQLPNDPILSAIDRLKGAPSIANKLGGKLSGAADDLAVKQFRLTPTQLSSFKTKFGEDAGQTIRKYGFNSAEDVTTKGIDPLQKQFGELVQGAGNISTDVLKKNFSDTIAKLTGANSSTNRAIGQQLQTEVDSLLAKYGKEIPAGKLNDIRREFDSLVNYTNKAADPAKYGVNKRVADVLRKTLQEADPTGKLKDVGQEISKLRQLSDNVAKQGELGRGSLPLNVTGLLGAGAGGIAGGLPGALSTLALTNAVNSPAGRKLLMGAVDKTAGKLSAPAGKDIGQTLKQATTRIGGVGAVRGVANGQMTSQSPSDLNNMADTMPTSTMSNPAMMPPNMNPSYTQPQETSNPLGYSSAEIGQALMAAYADGNTTAAKQLEGMYQLAASYEESQMKSSATKPMSAEASKQLANAQTGLQALDTIEQRLQSDPSIQQKSAIPGGILGGLAGKVLGTGQYEAARQQAIDVIGRMRSGGAITADEEKRFRQFLPQPYDDAQTSQYKLGLLRNAFNTLASSEQGSSTTDLASALKAAGY